MTIAELKELIKNMNDDLQVVIAIDPEGNGYWMADSDSCQGYMWDGDYYDDIDIREEGIEPDTEEVEIKSGGFYPAFCIFPEVGA